MTDDFTQNWFPFTETYISTYNNWFLYIYINLYIFSALYVSFLYDSFYSQSFLIGDSWPLCYIIEKTWNPKTLLIYSEFSASEFLTNRQPSSLVTLVWLSNVILNNLLMPQIAVVTHEQVDLSRDLWQGGATNCLSTCVFMIYDVYDVYECF